VTTLSCSRPFHLAPDSLQYSGPGDRFHKNIAALKLVHHLEAEGRPATDEERLVLAHYSAFGESALLNRLFRYDASTGRYALLSDYAAFLSSDEATKLRFTANTAFYTPLPIVAAIWRALVQLGLGTLGEFSMLEPAAGCGHFISAMPPELRERANITAVELDPVTARILGHVHPDVALHGGVGFERVELPHSSFDLVIGNVPFGEMAIHDPNVPAALRSQIHDYFFAKGLRLVRPGGLVALLTSWGTLDKQARAVRSYLAEQATLLSAFRLPNGTFQRISGSASATDLLILQKKSRPSAEAPCWLAITEANYPRSSEHRSMTAGSRYTREIKDPEQLAEMRVSVNQLWLDEPQRVIGQPIVVATDNSLWLQVRQPESDLATTLAEQLETLLPRDVVGPADDEPVESVAPAELEQVEDRRTRQLAIPATGGAKEERAIGLVRIYNAAKEVIKAELSGAPDDELNEAREQLNQVYELFRFQFGVINSPNNLKLFGDLPELQFLLALERNPRRLASGRWWADKERIFSERTLRPVQRALPGTCTPDEALLRCLDERGGLDLAFVASLSGLGTKQLLDVLGERVYRVPGTATYELSDVYLSGNVVAKLNDARAWAERDPALARNVRALEAVQPARLGPKEIIANLNAFWIPGEVMTGFVKHLLPAWTGAASYSAGLREWKLSDPSRNGAEAVEATRRWGTKRADAIAILEASLRGVPVTVYDVVFVDKRERRILNPGETIAAQEKQQAIADEFQRWLWSEEARADELCRLYNERFNTVRMRMYDGSHLSFPGINAAVLRGGDLASYQKGAVWQILQSPTTLIGFDTGGGKTFTAIAAAVEARRLGLCAKALVVVPKGLVGQWAGEARRLYPGVKVLAMGPEDFAKKRRGIVLSRIATGDWDLVIISHTSFKKLPPSADLITAFRDQETDRLRAYLEELRGTATSNDEKRSLKQIEKAIKKLEERLDGMLAGVDRDSERTITWNELGIGMLVIDEAHEFKNLYVPTRLANIAGLPSANSQRALDMRLKTWDLLRRQSKVVFLTATPIMNTIGEAYVMQLYLQQQQLEAVGIHHFDEWVSLYAQPKMACEMKPDGSGFRMHTRLATFVNLPEMAAMWRQVLNIRTKEQMNLPEPNLVTGKLITISVPASAAQKRFIASLAARADAVRAGEVDPTIDNVLRIVSDGRKAALDLRLVLPTAPRSRRGKIAALVANIASIYHTYAPARGTQLAFLDIATPKGRGKGMDEPPTRLTAAQIAGGEPEEHDEEQQGEVETAEERWLSNFVYYEIRDGLVALGVQRDEIAFIHDYTTRAERDALFAAVNEGRVRVVLGSTGKMSTGMNVQERLVALHNLDCPWRPGDLKQRHGRILRQGNLSPEAYIFNYVTEQSFDCYMWQTVEAKAHFIEQALAGEITARSIEDTADIVLSAAEVKAIASGNPKVMRKVALEMDVARLERARAAWLETRHRLQFERTYSAELISRTRRRIEAWQRAAALVAKHPHEPFVAAVATGMDAQEFRHYTKREEAGAAVNRLVKECKGAAAFLRKSVEGAVAHYRGLVLRAEASSVFGASSASLSLALPDGTILSSLGAETNLGIWQSVSHAIKELAASVRELQQRITQAEQRIVAIDQEDQRLDAWEGQASYDKATSELRQINVEFAAADEEASAARAQVIASTEASPATAKSAAEEENTLVGELLVLAHEERAAAGWGEWTPMIPPAPKALAWMEQEAERLRSRTATQVQQAEVGGTNDWAVSGAARCSGGADRSAASYGRNARVQFGNTPERSRRTVKSEQPIAQPTAPSKEGDEATQLSMF
jgi:N12 class adenine-specific DNA methylase